jgi:hypothetical protein
MSAAFSFRLTVETTWDKHERTVNSQSDIGNGGTDSVGVLAPNEAMTHRPGFTKLTAGGPSDSLILSRAQTHDKAFDVRPGPSVSQFVAGSGTFTRHREISEIGFLITNSINTNQEEDHNEVKSTRHAAGGGHGVRRDRYCCNVD